MLQGANETGDYFWDVWREPNGQCGASPDEGRAVFFGHVDQAAAVTVPARSELSTGASQRSASSTDQPLRAA